MNTLKTYALKITSVFLMLSLLTGFLLSCQENGNYPPEVSLPDEIVNLENDIDDSDPGEPQGEQNIEIKDVVNKTGESTIRIQSSRYYNDDVAPASFKSSISPKHVTLSGMIEGKIVKSVTFVNQSTIDVVLDGDSKSFKKSKALGTITISAAALNNNTPSSCSVIVEKATINLVSFSPPEETLSDTSNDTAETSNEKTEYTYKATFELSSGSFTSDNVKLANPTADSTISSVISDNRLYVVIEAFSDDSMVLVFDSSVTSFNKAFTFDLKTDRTIVIE